MRTTITECPVEIPIPIPGCSAHANISIVYGRVRDFLASYVSALDDLLEKRLKPEQMKGSYSILLDDDGLSVSASESIMSVIKESGGELEEMFKMGDNLVSAIKKQYHEMFPIEISRSDFFLQK